jgi:hypothetical protein
MVKVRVYDINPLITIICDCGSEINYEPYHADSKAVACYHCNTVYLYQDMKHLVKLKKLKPENSEEIELTS